MKERKLLVVDDEVDLLAELAPLLERSGFEVITAGDGAQALEIIERAEPDLIILDVMLPRIDGREVLRRLREGDNWTPVILLTQVGTPLERALSLQEGADDYINKPFDPFELVARIQAVLRRVQRGSLPLANCRRLLCGKLVLDRQSRQARLAGEPLLLTARAFGVLEYLMLHAGQTVLRERLLDEVWGWGCIVDSRAVDVRIAEIRKALHDDAGEPTYIDTVVGQGYRYLKQVEGKS
jgi:DNA-binding response OmpR family regulator